jgi:hypothetical protein
MPAPANLDWLFLTLGYTLAAIGAFLLLRSLFWDRSRARRRCPRCWYDMAGAPSLLCPECGHNARSIARLSHTRRRWRRAAGAALLAAAGLTTAEAPAIHRAGWVGAIPSWALVYWAPTSEPPGATLRRYPVPVPGMKPGVVTISTTGERPLIGMSGPEISFTTLGDIVVPPGGSYVINKARPVVLRPGTSATITKNGAVTIGPWPPDDPLGVRLHREMWSRLNRGALWQWESSIYVRRIIADFPSERPAAILRVPDHWPTGADVPILGRARTFGAVARLRQGSRGGPWSLDLTTTRLLENPGFTGPVDIEVHFLASTNVYGATLYTEILPSAVEINGTPDTFLGHLASPETNDQVRAALQPRLLPRESGNFAAAFHDRDASAQWQAIDFGIFFTTELRTGPRTIARGVGRADWSRPVWKTSDWSTLEWTEGPTNLAPLAASGNLELVLRADPAAAGAFYLAHPFELPSATCWSGELIQKLTTADLESQPIQVPHP